MRGLESEGGLLLHLTLVRTECFTQVVTRYYIPVDPRSSTLHDRKERSRHGKVDNGQSDVSHSQEPLQSMHRARLVRAKLTLDESVPYER